MSDLGDPPNQAPNFFANRATTIWNPRTHILIYQRSAYKAQREVPNRPSMVLEANVAHVVFISLVNQKQICLKSLRACVVKQYNL